jgi:hypothetical protein
MAVHWQDWHCVRGLDSANHPVRCIRFVLLQVVGRKERLYPMLEGAPLAAWRNSGFS